LWRRLPVSDLEIAERLGVTRQQVINLRQAARQRLARGLRANVSAPAGKGTI
jgi:DNA-directed RNA polymerase specialized sigma subunit